MDDYRLIRMVRQLRGLTLVEFSEVIGISDKTLSKLESGSMGFTEFYQERFNAALQKLKITNIEKLGLQILLEEKRRNENVE